MNKTRFDELCAYMGSLWGRELSNLQRAGGWKLLHELPDAAVENAIVEIAETGADRMPTWPVVLKSAKAVFERERDRLPALPAGDTLSDEEHRHVMFELRAKQTPEQRRRADRMSGETKHLPMAARLRMANSLLIPPYSRVDPGSWDRLFDQRLDEEAAKLQPA